MKNRLTPLHIMPKTCVHQGFTIHLGGKVGFSVLLCPLVTQKSSRTVEHQNDIFIWLFFSLPLVSWPQRCFGEDEHRWNQGSCHTKKNTYPNVPFASRKDQRKKTLLNTNRMFRPYGLPFCWGSPWGRNVLFVFNKIFFLRSFLDANDDIIRQKLLLPNVPGRASTFLTALVHCCLCAVGKKMRALSWQPAMKDRQ